MADGEKGLTLTEAKEKLANTRARLRSMKQRADETSTELMDTAASAAGAFAIGYYKADAQRRNANVQIAGMDPAAVIGLTAVIAGKNLDGDTGRLVRSLGRGVLDSLAYEAGRERGASAT